MNEVNWKIDFNTEMPHNQLPVLEYRGKILPQVHFRIFCAAFLFKFFCFIIKSRTNARFLARRHGLGGADDWEAAEIES